LPWSDPRCALFRLAAAVVLAAFFGASAPARAQTTITCDSIHAAQIAIEARLSNCHADPIPANHYPTAAGGSTGICVGWTANECATFFRNNPEVGLKTGSGYYVARFFGFDEDLRMTDGTRPLMYFKAGSTNNWLFFFGGGAGMCKQNVVQTEHRNGSSDLDPQGITCFDNTDYNSTEIETTAGKGFGMPWAMDFDGILSANGSNPFSGYNIVVFARTNDFFMGNLTLHDEEVHRDLTTSTSWQVSHLPLQGNAIVEAAFHAFDNPNLNDPDLSDAERVLFVVSSSGANAIHRIDAWAALMATLTSNDGSAAAHIGVLAASSGMTPDSFVFEGNDDGPSCSVYAASCASGYDEPPAGAVAHWMIGNTPVTFDDGAFRDYVDTAWNGSTDPGVAPGGEAHPITSVSTAWNAMLDGSCLVDEDSATTWKCRSTFYVMLNHLSTPLFIAHSLADSSNIKGHPKGATARTAAGTVIRWEETHWPGTTENPMVVLGRRAFESWIADRDAGAVGESANSGPFGLWAPMCVRHEPEKYADTFFDTGGVGVELDGTTLATALASWFEGGTTEIHLDGHDDGAGYITTSSGSACFVP
jgi:hypothetical protein